jgi:N utilization substance protein B
MKRHEQREQVFRLLFREEFHSLEEMPQQVKLYFEDTELAIGEKDADSIRKRLEAVESKIPELDQMINDNTEGWDTSRMGKVELAVLRLACFEIRFDEDVPDSVAIDEAVELAKVYGQETSGGFVNGVLAKVVKAFASDSEPQS